MLFKNRTEAGRKLAERLYAYADRQDVVVLGLPRGGLPVAEPVARTLNAPLDAFVVRKLGVPGHEELAMGAIASGDVRFINDDITESLGISASDIERVAREEGEELQRRDLKYRGNAKPVDLRDRIVILVDDGIATGATLHAAAIALRQSHPARIVAAIPVAPKESCDRDWLGVDEVVCVETPEPFRAIGLWYDSFGQTSDEEVRQILDRAGERKAVPSA